MTAPGEAPLEAFDRPRVTLRPDDLPLALVPESLPRPQPAWFGDPTFLQKGGDCFVCTGYIAPGTSMAEVVWCQKHHFRHRGCLPAKEEVVPGRRRSGPPCTCSPEGMKPLPKCTAQEVSRYRFELSTNLVIHTGHMRITVVVESMDRTFLVQDKKAVAKALDLDLEE